MITVVYAIFAGGTIVTLLRDASIVPRIGRRGMMLGAVLIMMAATGVLAAWKDLPGLLIGRLLTGVSVGLAAGTAITYLVELRLRADPNASVVRARTIGTSVNVGALGVGPLIAGCLAEWVSYPLTVSYLVFLGLGVFALIGLSVVPETGTTALAISCKGASSLSTLGQASSSGSGRNTRSLLCEWTVCWAVGALPGDDIWPHFHALAGVTLFLVFSAGVVSQLATSKLQASRVLALGTFSMLIGLVLLVVSVRLATPSLALFLISGVMIGAGAGAVFKGTTGIVLEASAPEDRVEMTSELLIALFVGLSVPVIGAGIALESRRESAQYRPRIRHPCRAGRVRIGLGFARAPTQGARYPNGPII